MKTVKEGNYQSCYSNANNGMLRFSCEARSLSLLLYVCVVNFLRLLRSNASVLDTDLDSCTCRVAITIKSVPFYEELRRLFFMISSSKSNCVCCSYLT